MYRGWRLSLAETMRRIQLPSAPLRRGVDWSQVPAQSHKLNDGGSNPPPAIFGFLQVKVFHGQIPSDGFYTVLINFLHHLFRILM